MKLQHIDLENLKLSPLNVRKHGTKDGDDLVPSIRSLGVLQPLLVRQNCEGFEIVAGQRRYHACRTIAKDEAIEPLPCIVMEDGDNAKAIEASLAENIERLSMDEIDQYEAFAALMKQGRSIEEIATHFGVTERLVTQRLAIADLYSPILNAYRREEVEPSTIRLLTMASKTQQKAWFKLFRSEDEYAPIGYHLKNWLFGGEDIPVEAALFEVENYTGAIITDLFSEERYFSDPALFWEYQSKAIASLMQEFREDGWADVILHDVDERWSEWEHVKASKDEGGVIHITCRSNGEVQVHEGYITQKEAKHRAKAEASGKDGDQRLARPEITKSMQTYLGLHRHAAVRTELLGHTDIALRLCVAQIIAGSALWAVHAEPQKSGSEAISESLNTNKAEAAFSAQRETVCKLLELKADKGDTLVARKDEWEISRDLYAVFVKLLGLSDQDVMTVLALVVAETLPAHSAMTEILGKLLSVDMSKYWTPDETFFELLRDKETINAMLTEIGGKSVADGNLAATAKVQKKIAEDFLNGTNGRERKTGWIPRYMHFPMQDYTKRSGIHAVEDWKAVKHLLKAA